MKKSHRRLLLLVAALLLLLVLLRLFVVDVVSVSSAGPAGALLPGDRLLVERWAYGWRLPFAPERRWPARRAQRGDWLVCNAPSDTCRAVWRRRMVAGQCLAAPGDTVWFSWNYRLVPRAYPASTLYPFVVPARGERVAVTPWNARLLALTLRLHEGRAATLVGDTALLLGGRRVRSVRFAQDYYWLSSGSEAHRYDSRYFGFVPASHLVGRVGCVLFSLRAGEPLSRRLRAERFFYRLSSEIPPRPRP